MYKHKRFLEKTRHESSMRQRQMLQKQWCMIYMKQLKPKERKKNCAKSLELKDSSIADESIKIMTSNLVATQQLKTAAATANKLEPRVKSTRDFAQPSYDLGSTVRMDHVSWLSLSATLTEAFRSSISWKLAAELGHISNKFWKVSLVVLSADLA